MSAYGHKLRNQEHFSKEDEDDWNREHINTIMIPHIYPGFVIITRYPYNIKIRSTTTKYDAEINAE